MKCHDCKRTLKKGEEYMPYETEIKTFYKCKACHQKEPLLRNWRPTEVWSRIVGYIRPVSQWNTAKRQEFKDRKNYKLK